MIHQFVCSNGHAWDLASGSSDPTLPRLPACPKCGLPAQTQAINNGNAVDAPPIQQDNAATSIATAPQEPGFAETLPPSGNQPASLTARPTIPGYEIIRELGRGGMGVVYLARQEKLGRLVALKMILAGDHASDSDRTRLFAEAKAVARLQHPNIVQLLEVGEVGSRMFFSLEYLDGGNLSERLDGTPWRSPDAVATLLPVARAVQHAHEMGILHRDLKPANLLIADPTSRATNSSSKSTSLEPENKGSQSPSQILTLKITDFGLAKDLEGSEVHTQTGVVMGTPSYMAPEQASGHSRTAGVGVDIYALGSILYELITGRPPFRGETPLDTMLQSVSEEPVRPTRLQPKIPRDLETICLKCLQKDPRKRYATAAEFADDLQFFLDGKPIHARPVGAAGRTWRWAKRNPVVAGLLGMLGAVLVSGLIVVFILWQRTLKQEKLAKANLVLATEAVDRMLTSVTDERLAYVPQFEDERRKILEDAVNFYDQFLQQESNDPVIRRQMALACYRLGKVFLSLGKPEQGRDSLVRAVALQEQLIAENPDDTTTRNDLAQSLLGLGGAERMLDHTSAAEPLYQRARELAEQLTREHGDDVKFRSTLAEVLGQIGYQNLQSSRLAEAEAAYRASIEQWDRIVAAQPNDANLAFHRAHAYYDIAFFQYNLQQFEPAEKNSRQAMAMFEDLQKHNPKNRRQVETSLANTRLILASVLAESKHSSQAREILDKVMPVYRRLVQDYQLSPIYRFDMARALQTAAQSRLDEKPNLAEEDLNQAIKLLEELVRNHPDAFYYAFYLQRAYTNLIVLHLRQGQKVQAMADLKKAIEQAKSASQHDSLAEYSKLGLAGNLAQLAKLLREEGKDREALPYLDEAISILTSMPRPVAASPHLLLGTRVARILVLARLGEYLQAMKEAAGLRQPLPKNPNLVYNLACAYALAAQAARNDAASATPTREERAKEYLGESADLIRHLAKTGFFKQASEVQLFWHDADLELLRADLEFRKWLDANLPMPQSDK